jgi:hypothetical protein
MKKINIIAIALAMVAAFTMSAVASEWDFYGSARVSTFVTDTDNKTAKDTTIFNEGLQGNSRIGASVKVNDELAARFEVGNSATTWNTRKIYGEWDFGPGKFLVGQTDTPLNGYYSNQVYGGDEDLLSYGGVYSGRSPMLQLTFGNFKIAAIQPKADTIGVVGGITENTMPRIEAYYKLNFNNAFIEIAGGYNTYSLLDPATAIENDIDSYVGAIGAGITFDRYYLNGNIFFGQNIGPYGMSHAPDSDPVITGATVADNDSYGYVIVAGAKINDMFSVEAGYGYTEAEVDNTAFTDDAAASYYVQSVVTLAPGVFFVPELGVIDNKTDKAGVEESDVLYYGVKWQINF